MLNNRLKKDRCNLILNDSSGFLNTGSNNCYLGNKTAQSNIGSNNIFIGFELEDDHDDFTIIDRCRCI